MELISKVHNIAIDWPQAQKKIFKLTHKICQLPSIGLQTFSPCRLRGGHWWQPCVGNIKFNVYRSKKFAGKTNDTSQAIIAKQAMAEQGHTRSLSSKLNLIRLTIRS